MKKIAIQLAGFNIQILFKKSAFPKLRKRVVLEFIKLWQGALVENNLSIYDFTIEFIDSYTFKNIHIARKNLNYIIFYNYKDAKTIQTFYQNSNYQITTILSNVISTLLLRNKGFFLHSSSSYFDSKAFVFVGRSGAGKSTSAQLLDKEFPRLTDDITLIRKINDHFVCFQNPIRQNKDDKIGLRINTQTYEIYKLFFLKKSTTFKIEKLTDKELILENLTKQIINPSALAIKNSMEFVAQFSEFYMLNFAKNQKRMISFFKKITQEA